MSTFLCCTWDLFLQVFRAITGHPYCQEHELDNISDGQGEWLIGIRLLGWRAEPIPEPNRGKQNDNKQDKENDTFVHRLFLSFLVRDDAGMMLPHAITAGTRPHLLSTSWSALVQGS